jgi:hypothetical protein
LWVILERVNFQRPEGKSTRKNKIINLTHFCLVVQHLI